MSNNTNADRARRPIRARENHDNAIIAARRLAEGERRSIAALLVPHGRPLQAGKTYFKLLHGRDKPDENLDDWGFSGPVFGPLDWFHITYLQTYRFGRESFEAEIAVTADMFVWDGKYYGDAEVFVAEKNRGAG